MRKVAIRTAGHNGQNLFKLLADNPCYKSEAEVVAYIDSDTNKIGTMLNGTPVISLFEAGTLYQEGKIEKVLVPCEFHSIAFQNRHMLDEFLRELYDIGIAKEDALVSNVLAKQSGTAACQNFETDFVPYDQFYHIRYLEFSAAFHCNLNCKGCSHFSPLVHREFPEFESIQRDFRRLKELVPHIHRIRILGGEPLLNPELCKYIRLVRDTYPFTELRVVTNGILLKSQPEEFFQCLKDNDVTVDVSVYRPLRAGYHNMLDSLKKHKIKSTMYNCYEFVPTLKREKAEFPFANTEKTCIYRNLAEGYISTCMLMHDVKYYNAYFGEEIPHADGLIDLHDPDLTSKELIRRLKEKHRLCDYCESYKHMSVELSSVYHHEIQIFWDRYQEGDRPVKSDWFAKE